MSYDSALYKRRNRRHGAMLQTQFYHHRGKQSRHLTWKYTKWTPGFFSSPLPLFSPFHLSTHLSLSFKKPFSPYCMFKLACTPLPHPPLTTTTTYIYSLIPLTVSARGLKASLVTVSHQKQFVCLSVLCLRESERRDGKSEREKGEGQHVAFVMDVRDSPCFRGWQKRKGWGQDFGRHTQNDTYTRADRSGRTILSVLVWLVKFNKCIKRLSINYLTSLLWKRLYLYVFVHSGKH